MEEWSWVQWVTRKYDAFLSFLWSVEKVCET